MFQTIFAYTYICLNLMVSNDDDDNGDDDYCIEAKFQHDQL